MNLHRCFGTVACLFPLAFSQCAIPPGPTLATDQLHGDVHTELTDYREDLIKQPPPRYPPGPRGQRAQGIGVFRIRFNYDSGQAVAVTVVNSTGHVSLDQASMEALRNWTIKPRTWHTIDVLIRFATASPKAQPSSGARQFPV